MTLRRVPAVAAAVLVALTLWMPATAPAVSTMGQREIEEALTCQCGCGLTVASCNHLECGFAVPARKRIAEALARGESPQSIIDGFKAEYGEKVLSSPVPEGFNVMAWIAPYATIVIAGSLMFAFFRRRARKAAAEAPAGPTGAAPGPGGDERLARLRREVEDLQR